MVGDLVFSKLFFVSTFEAPDTNRENEIINFGVWVISWVLTKIIIFPLIADYKVYTFSIASQLTAIEVW